jgi:transposase
MLAVHGAICRRPPGAFLGHYHKRSNVESTFRMIKAKFRDHVRSKTPVAMVNETLCKIICHNICVFVQEARELGIAIEFPCRAGQKI